MRDYWHPATPGTAALRAAHAEQYDALLNRVMDDPAFAFSDDASSPSWDRSAARNGQRCSSGR